MNQTVRQRNYRQRANTGRAMRSLYVDVDIWERFADHAREHGTTVSALIRRTMREEVARWTSG